MDPSNISFLSFRIIFHFHDYGRKGTFKCWEGNHEDDELSMTCQALERGLRLLHRADPSVSVEAG